MCLRIAVATTGGDAPGMNACIRAIVKAARVDSDEIVGIHDGGLGLIRNSADPPDFVELTPSEVSGIIDRGGTILRSARDLAIEEYLRANQSRLGPVSRIQASSLAGPGDTSAHMLADLASDALDANSIEGIVLIGGDTTLRAAIALARATKYDLPIVVVPASIDNDVPGTYVTVGFDSAVQVATEHIDCLRATATAMRRVFIVEVMGRNSGFLAAEVAVATGAEAVLVPEIDYTTDDVEALCQAVADVHSTGASSIIVVAEGATVPAITSVRDRSSSPTVALDQYWELLFPDVETRVSVLGHVQRGAPPTAATRNLASRSGALALAELQSGSSPRMISIGRHGAMSVIDIEEGRSSDRTGLFDQLELQRSLAY